MADAFVHVAITGASSGIGAALAREHAAPGVLLSLCGRDAGRLQAVAGLCEATGAQVRLSLFDLRDGKALADWIAAADGEREIDLVYACAGLGGIASVAGPDGEDPEVSADLIRVNMGAAIATATAAAARLKPRGRGRIVLIGSLAGRAGLPQCPTYSATKAGLEIYADGLRRLLRPAGVGVTLIEPGFVDTPMSKGVPGMVFLWSADKAARRIRRAAERGRATLRFPLPLDIGLRLLRLLPRPLADWILVAIRKRDM
ncbi:MAG: SDR family NAD(P)-dependent oxidoreductase [Shinella zoogloeoides]|uniref:SDR family NAD(P)-dependent oxidoreductase n=1 Tax=Shinella zoogloeoides TaxID=352475 RepID=UPI003C7557C8